MLALAVYEAGICECGFHSSLTSDRANGFAFEERTCLVCGDSERLRRVQQSRDEHYTRGLGNAAPSERLPSDGRHTSIRMLSPAEMAERQASTKS